MGVTRSMRATNINAPTIPPMRDSPEGISLLPSTACHRLNSMVMSARCTHQGNQRGGGNLPVVAKIALERLLMPMARTTNPAPSSTNVDAVCAAIKLTCDQLNATPLPRKIAKQAGGADGERQRPAKRYYEFLPAGRDPGACHDRNPAQRETKRGQRRHPSRIRSSKHR